MHRLRYLLILFLLLLTACAHHSYRNSRYQQAKDSAPRRIPQRIKDVSKIPNATPRFEPKSPYGNPTSYKVLGKTYYVLKTAKGYDKVGYASWYGTKFHGHLTSNREVYNLYSMTAASATLPLPSYVRVTNLENHKSVIVKVNDRGPFNRQRILDLSYVAAKKLGVLQKGTALVRVTAIDPTLWARNQGVRNSILARPENKIKIAKPTITLAQTPKIYIQAGAFSTKKNANQFKWRLSQFLKKPIIVSEDMKNNQPIFRVRIGPLSASTEESNRIKSALKSRGLNASQVTLST